MLFLFTIYKILGVLLTFLEVLFVCSVQCVRDDILLRFVHGGVMAPNYSYYNIADAFIIFSDVVY